MPSIPRTIARQFRDILAPREPGDLFPEMAFSLFAFVALLHRSVQGRVTPLCFLSREGQPLMRLYEIYRGPTGDPPIRYIEASRRSTFLPSLGPLDTEPFESLFRQYWKTSAWEFLASLGLEDDAPRLQVAIDATDQGMRRRHDHLPSAPFFQRLLRSHEFQALFEEQRVVRREALLTYLAELHGGRIPAELAVVDVGWKGTIQDNLFGLMTQLHDGGRCIKGHYLGLVDPRPTQPGNSKVGLLFSCVGRKSSHFRIFNESRTLFELLLAADHASVGSYVRLPSGEARPTRDAFEEEVLVSQHVLPIQRSIVERFRLVCDVAGARELSAEQLVSTASVFHSRMVFSPTANERQWFLRAFHVENFGVFERTHFSSGPRIRGLGARLRFVAGLARRRNRLGLGFWPYVRIHEEGWPAAAVLYGMVRRLQSFRGLNTRSMA